MKLSLKRLAAVTAALAAKEPKASVAISLSKFDNTPTPEEVVAATDAFEASLAKAESIIAAVAVCRNLVGQHNCTLGITSLLGERAAVTKMIDKLSKLKELADPGPTSLEALGRQLEAARTAAPAYGRETIQCVLPVGEQISAMLKRYRKELIRIENTLAGLNFSTEVEIPEDVRALLEEFDLV